ncbi:MAG: hypothetical protein HC845_13195, partial [Akkermansiaceae bacterium]|nr:hypothetical protein [Akkermansiaceae bacterium]
MPSENRKPYWLFPNLLSLDAPLVAICWLYIFSKTWQVSYLPWAAYASLGLVVWVIYASDRLLDSLLQEGTSGSFTARHEFHRNHRRKFLFGVVLAGFSALALVVTQLPSTV